MLTYRAPLRDMHFVLHELLGLSELTKLPDFNVATSDLVDAVLGEGARFCERELLPLAASGDAEGCRYEKDVVHTPKGFPSAYRRFREGGWPGLTCDPAVGGQGLPEIVNLAF